MSFSNDVQKNMFESVINNIWKLIQIICVLYSFGTIIWKLIPARWHVLINGLFNRAFKTIKLVDEASPLGQLLLDDIHFIGGLDYDYGIEFSIDSHPVEVPSDFQKLAKRLEQENKERLKIGKKPVFADLHPYAIHAFTPLRDDKNERPIWHVLLRDSSYFYSLISILAMDEMVPTTDDSNQFISIRDKYYAELIKDPMNPYPHGNNLVHAFGMNTLVLTKDNSFVLSKRNKDTVSTGGDCLHLSVGEHLNEDVLDIGIDRKPNAVKVIKKGLYQELGIDDKRVDDSAIRFYGIAFAELVCQYGVLGFTHLKSYTDSEIRTAWELSKDGRYENKEIVFIDANINSVVKYLNDNPGVVITKFALLNICVSIMMENELGRVSQHTIEVALKKLRKNAIK